MNDQNINRLKKWTTNGAIVGLIIGVLNSAVLGKSGFYFFSIQNAFYILGHVAGVSVLALGSAAITNALSK